MTGSSARKLKSANVNLLAGRAFVYELFPFTQEELGEQFDLSQVLNWGTLPALYTRHQEESERKQFLQNYSKTYLKEEIWYEQFIRKMDPFLRFLEIAAQMNGEILNYSAIALDTGVDDKTIKNYFSILEETLIGVFLPPYLSSVRKTTSKSKFYFFDTGIVKALTNTLSIPLVEFSSPFGKAFEHFIIIEILRLSSYAQSDFKFFYLRTKDGAEVDLVVERPQEKKLFIEIKSTVDVREDHLRNLKQLAKDHDAEAVCFSRDKRAWKSDNATVYPWAEGMKKFFRKAED
jgi:predicted AAA+ superfamily ATPase